MSTFAKFRRDLMMDSGSMCHLFQRTSFRSQWTQKRSIRPLKRTKFAVNAYIVKPVGNVKEKEKELL